MSFYEDMAQLATDMIAEYGRDMTLRSYTVSGESFSPTKTPADKTIKGVFSMFRTDDIDGTLIKTEDKAILIDSAFAPQKGGSVVDGSSVYEIVDFVEIKPGDTSILYKLQVRK